MDPRVRTHAEVIVEQSVDLRESDDVIITASPAAEELVVALYEAIGERGGTPLYLGNLSRARRAFVQASDPEDFQLPEHRMGAVENADVWVGIGGSYNTTEMSDVDPETYAAYGEVREPIRDELTDKRWVATQYPAPGNAQDAEMSTEAYEEFVWGAINKDWDAQREFQQQLVEILDPAEEVRIVSGDRTDVRMSVDGMVAANDTTEKNLPGGEVYTAPVPDSVEGEALFDVPVMIQGREVEQVSLRFEEGEVVDYAASKNEDVLESVLDTDEGARRLGELGIGMNRDIDQFTRNVQFDEKMGDTVHLAVGRAHEWTVGPNREGNDSAVHVDMIVDVSEDSFVEVDGEVVQRDGTFRFEDDFEE